MTILEKEEVRSSGNSKRTLIKYDIRDTFTVNKWKLLDTVQRTYSDIKGLRCCSTKTIENNNVAIQYNQKFGRYTSTHKCKSKACIVCQEV